MGLSVVQVVDSDYWVRGSMATMQPPPPTYDDGSSTESEYYFDPNEEEEDDISTQEPMPIKEEVLDYKAVPEVMAEIQLPQGSEWSHGASTDCDDAVERALAMASRFERELQQQPQREEALTADTTNSNESIMKSSEEKPKTVIRTLRKTEEVKIKTKVVSLKSVKAPTPNVAVTNALVVGLRRPPSIETGLPSELDKGLSVPRSKNSWKTPRKIENSKIQDKSPPNNKTPQFFGRKRSRSPSRRRADQSKSLSRQLSRRSRSRSPLTRQAEARSRSTYRPYPTEKRTRNAYEQSRSSSRPNPLLQGRRRSRSRSWNRDRDATRPDHHEQSRRKSVARDRNDRDSPRRSPHRESGPISQHLRPRKQVNTASRPNNNSKVFGYNQTDPFERKVFKLKLQQTDVDEKMRAGFLDNSDKWFCENRQRRITLERAELMAQNMERFEKVYATSIVSQVELKRYQADREFSWRVMQFKKRQKSLQEKKNLLLSSDIRDDLWRRLDEDREELIAENAVLYHKVMMTPKEDVLKARQKQTFSAKPNAPRGLERPFRKKFSKGNPNLQWRAPSNTVTMQHHSANSRVVVGAALAENNDTHSRPSNTPWFLKG